MGTTEHQGQGGPGLEGAVGEGMCVSVIQKSAVQEEKCIYGSLKTA